ncbi:MAG: cobalamin biosynthesis protein CobG [Planktomarina sp.]
MMKSPNVKGRCPTARRPMESGDGLIVRVTPPLARLLPDQTAVLCDLSSTYGNGIIDLTQRGNLQLRGVKADDLPRLWAGLEDHGLIAADPQIDSKATLHMQPFWKTGDISHRLYNILQSDRPSWPDLPSKVSVLIDTGDAPLMADISADFRFERSDAGLILRADGMTKGQPITEETAADALCKMMHWFIAAGGWEAKRMAKLTQNIKPPADMCTMPPLPNQTKPNLGGHGAGALLGVPFGQMHADDLRVLAGAELRITPWRMIYVESGDIPQIHNFVTDPHDPRMTVHACPGAPACLQALQPTRALAAQIKQGGVHVSGCAKGCAHRGAAKITIVAAQSGFDLVRNGTAWDKPVLRGLSEAEILDELAP